MRVPARTPHRDLTEQELRAWNFIYQKAAARGTPHEAYGEANTLPASTFWRHYARHMWIPFAAIDRQGFSRRAAMTLSSARNVVC